VEFTWSLEFGNWSLKNLPEIEQTDSRPEDLRNNETGY